MRRRKPRPDGASGRQYRRPKAKTATKENPNKSREIDNTRREGLHRVGDSQSRRPTDVGGDCGFIPVISVNDGGLIGVVTDSNIAMAAYTQGK